MNSRRNFISKGAVAAVAVLAAKPMAVASSIDQLFFPSGKGDMLNLFYANNSFRFSGNKIDTTVFNEFAGKIQSLKKNSSQDLWLDAGYSVPGSGLFDLQRDQLLGIMQDVNKAAAIESVVRYSGTLSYKTISLSTAKVGVIIHNAGSDKDLFMENAAGESEIFALASQLKTENNCTCIVLTSSDTALDFIGLSSNSSDLDVVICVVPSSKNKINIVKNKLKSEVILVNQGGEVRNLLRNIEIAFDDKGLKKSIQFKNFFV